TSVIIASNTVSPFLKSIMGLFPQLLFLFIGSVFICGFLKVFQLYQNKKKLLKTFKSFPGPASHWFYGHSKQTVRAQELVKVLEWTEKYPYAFPRWFNGFMATLHISHPDYAKAVFNHGGKQFILFVSAGEGLLVLHGPKWFQHRRLLTPGFHYDILKPYVALIAESTKVMLDKWEKLLEKDTTKSLEMFEHVSLMTLDSIMKCAFGSQHRPQSHRFTFGSLSSLEEGGHRVFSNSPCSLPCCLSYCPGLFQPPS
uniref:Cytochrome P450 n=1 Tax=Varanus komodoensis TaxID=61221 RepID=A0A8D2JBZ9_VARKO